ncbi:MAG: molybdopterin-dependent oxidoreductase, partial [Candidatus Marinimicrobia bacterium]|nr:molybdopterin-dependent oxidoreductase [Candidatus Neomarinimicrobiota bacterium]
MYVQNRGYNNKIAVFDSVPLDNPLAGNVADICPVGALLLKDYIHTTRFWHLSQTPSVCTECTAGCNITVDAANNKIHRIISRVNEQANGHFICDYGRYAHNKYVEATITSPLLKVEDSWKEVSWEEAYQVIKDQVVATGGGANLRALASPVYPNETNFLLANLVDTVVEKKSLALLPIQNGDDQTFPAGFRISGDKGGNRRGTEDMTRKLTVKPQTLFRGDVGVLLALDGDGRTAIDGDVEKLLKASPFTVILASNMNKFTERANLILPVAGPFQREGTITNDRGLVQWLEPALQLTGEAKPDWQVVAELGQLL